MQLNIIKEYGLQSWNKFLFWVYNIKILSERYHPDLSIMFKSLSIFKTDS